MPGATIKNPSRVRVRVFGAEAPSGPAPLRLQMAKPAATVWLESTGRRSRGKEFKGQYVARPEPDLTDEELVDRCRADDHAAFTAIVNRYKDRIYWLVMRMVGSADAEDLTQEVFLRAYRAIPTLRSGGTLKTWLFRIAHNLCLTELARRGRRGEQLSVEEEGDERLHSLMAETSKRFEDQTERRDFARRVEDAVQKLPVQYRTALTLYYIDEAKYEEIAEVMGIPLGTVKTYIYRARLRLRELVIGGNS